MGKGEGKGADGGATFLAFVALFKTIVARWGINKAIDATCEATINQFEQLYLNRNVFPDRRLKVAKRMKTFVEALRGGGLNDVKDAARDSAQEMAACPDSTMYQECIDLLNNVIRSC